MSFALFAIECFINSLVQTDYKYSFFFYLDIIATLSLIPDIRWLNDAIGEIVSAQPSYLSVNAIPGVVRIILHSIMIDERAVGISGEHPEDSEGT